MNRRYLAWTLATAAALFNAPPGTAQTSPTVRVVAPSRGVSATEATRLGQELIRLRLAVHDRRLIYVGLSAPMLDAVYMVQSTSPVASDHCVVNPRIEVIGNVAGQVDGTGAVVFPASTLSRIVIGFFDGEGAGAAARHYFYVLDAASVAEGQLVSDHRGDLTRLFDIRAQDGLIAVSPKTGDIRRCFVPQPADPAAKNVILSLINEAATPVTPVDESTYRALEHIYAQNASAQVIAARTTAYTVSVTGPGRTRILAELARAPGLRSGAFAALPPDLDGCLSSGSPLDWYRTVSCGNQPLAAAVAFAGEDSIIGNARSWLQRLGRGAFHDETSHDKRSVPEQVTLHVASEPRDAAIFFGAERSPYRTVTDLRLSPERFDTLRVIKEGFRGCILEQNDFVDLLSAPEPRWLCRLKRLASPRPRSGRR